ERDQIKVHTIHAPAFVGGREAQAARLLEAGPFEDSARPAIVFHDPRVQRLDAQLLEGKADKLAERVSDDAPAAECRHAEQVPDHGDPVNRIPLGQTHQTARLVAASNEKASVSLAAYGDGDDDAIDDTLAPVTRQPWI